jgi:leader peptidase (prepilin peptidase)/N-methyltransferase
MATEHRTQRSDGQAGPPPAAWACGLLLTPAVRAAVAYHSVPAGSPWRQRCDLCNHRLRYPWLSKAFRPRARCEACDGRLGAPPYTVEIGAVLAAAALVVAARPVLETVALAWWAVCALALVFVDAAVHRLPDRLTYPAALGTVGLFGLAAAVEGSTGALVRALLAGLTCAAVFGVLALVLGRQGPGLGDAKLLLSTGAVLGWFGWGAVLAGLFLAFLSQALWAIALLVTRRANRKTHLAMGPFLIAATLVVVALLG